MTRLTRAGLFPGFRGPIPQDVLDLPKPWNDLTAPFPNSTPLARFYENLPGLSYTSTTPNAKSILQASCEVTFDFIANPLGMAISSGGSILAMTGMSGWKERSPSLSYGWLAGDNQDYLAVHSAKVGLNNVAHQIETDEQRKLVFIADEDRIKSYDWSSLEEEQEVSINRARRKRKANQDLLPKHTMDSEGFSGPLLMLPNGRLARAGEGEVAVWGLDGLQTHGPRGTDIIGEVEDDEEEDPWGRDDYEDVENSSGSRLDQVIRFAFDPTLKLNTWNLHPNNPSMVLCGQNSMRTRKYGMVMVDLEAGGKEVVRVLGHGATVTKITTGVSLEQGQGGHVFCTGCTDGMARIYDVRQRLPVLTVEGDSGEGACTAILAYPDGIPVIFTGAMSTTQCIRTWDVRAKATVYELSTGNNDTKDLAWDGHSV
ncbi:hypothetical protein K435DRAFT_691509 [Dendrothele bispora CBS 962.96]|uniref:WD40 repeat-like protein n=1 Tax=Dendrothele bispora (strain CBS 962.96) TaxID=1314807 RepID=A0A4S8L1X2_DENBC|nr:hypothetical protein K435DRAFT_691509 [Dendrothele bispora CBS 962.96]